MTSARPAWDLIVVGGGTAGCVVAARASEDPGRRVLLLEDGPDPRPVPEVIADPKRQTEVVLESPYVRMYDVERPDGSSFPLLSGRIMGGGSAINNLAVVRPWAVDFEAWARVGGPDWSYAGLLPLMRAIETDPDLGEDPLHGGDGPVHLQRSYRLDDPDDPAISALVEAAGDLGLPPCPDLNVPAPFGVCASPYAIRDGVRQSTAVAYLDPARQRPNLTVLPDATVSRVVVRDGVVRGVEALTAEGRVAFDAPEVVLAAGVFHSPQLLLLSGIGPPDELARHGIAPIHPMAGVGQGYRDHAVVYVTYEGTPGLREDVVIPKVRLIARSDEARAVPDLHVFLHPSIRMAGLPPMLPVSIRLLEHRSAGDVRLASTDPRDLPEVRPGLLEAEADLEALTGGFRFVERLVRRPALADMFGPLVTPGPGVDIAEHIRTSFISYYHGVGTCRLGPAGDPGSVVGPDLRVHGIDGLRVADASVLPTVPHANTSLAAILVGEIAGRHIAAGR